MTLSPVISLLLDANLVTIENVMTQKQKHNQEEALYNMRHSCAHLLAAAVQHIWPDVKLGVGPVIDYGCYYDFDLKHRISEADFPKIESTMHALAARNDTYEREELDFAEAKKRMTTAGQPYKVELIEAIEKTGSTAVVSDGNASELTPNHPSTMKKSRPQGVSFYTTGNFVDLCRGGHVKSTKQIGPFKIISVAGAYWRGDKNNPMMQRIYVACFPTQQELDDYLKMLEQAKSRDHKKLGRELDLFTFSELVGPGLPLFTPKGTIVRNLLDDFVWRLRKARGYEQVDIPHITKKELYETSGHWEKFKDDLFKIKSRDGHEFALKPMNCPHHTQIYARRSHSYRDLPVRYANTTKVYRDEQTGELNGLTRVRSITQDDAHVFCRYSQIKKEIDAIWDIIDEFYKTLGFELKVDLSFHNPKEVHKYLGDEAIWQKAEDEMRDIAHDRGVKVREVLGEAAFYGPKIDFIALDAIGRQHQVATIQLDMNMPERFNLTCVNEKGKNERIVIIHAAIMGSIERFLGVYIEHTAGKFPFWLAPVQVKILPIGDRHVKYAHQIGDQLKAQDLRIEIDNKADTISKKIRTAQAEQVPYMIVIGDKEIQANNLSIRSRDNGDLGSMDIEKFLDTIKTTFMK